MRRAAFLLGVALVLAGCGSALYEQGLGFSADSGGVLCPGCQHGPGERRRLSPEALDGLRALGGGAWRAPLGERARSELRHQ